MKLRDEVTGQAEISYTKRPALHAKKCAGCGRIFDMAPFCNDRHVAEIRGTFDRTANDEDGGGLGNMFIGEHACSFACVDRVFRGGWRDLPRWAPFARAEAELARVEVLLTNRVKDEAALVREWEQAPERAPGMAYVTFGHST